MEKFVGIAKEHPYLIGGGVLAGALIIYLSFHKSTVTAGTLVSADPSSTQEQLNDALTISQDQISAQTNQAQFALEANSDNNQTQITLAAGANATALAGANINASTAITEQNAANATAITQQAAANQVSMLSIAAGAGLQAQINSINSGLQSQAELYQANVDAHTDALQVASAVPLYTGYYGSTYDYTLQENLAANTKTAAQIASTGSGANGFDLSAYTSGLNSLISSITQKVTPGDPTATASST